MPKPFMLLIFAYEKIEIYILTDENNNICFNCYYNGELRCQTLKVEFFISSIMSAKVRVRFTLFQKENYLIIFERDSTGSSGYFLYDKGKLIKEALTFETLYSKI